MRCHGLHNWCNGVKNDALCKKADPSSIFSMREEDFTILSKMKT